jgi:hypothetical protein
MNGINKDRIPNALKSLNQWVLWSLVERDGKETKIPFQLCDQGAKSNDSNTWAAFEPIWERYCKGGRSGIGFMFSESDPFCGIDLDGCRNPATGVVAEWAREIIVKFASYAEVSPSKTGVKVFCRGVWGRTRHQVKVNAEPVCYKAPAIEVYDRVRYFAVTGWCLLGHGDVTEAQGAIDWLLEKYFQETPIAQPAQGQLDFRCDEAVIDRARKYVAQMPPAISGQAGHNATFRVACVLALGFALPEPDALNILREYNQTCQPPWSERELQHKITQAGKQPGQRGYLRNASPQRWNEIPVPTYREPPLVPEPKLITLTDAARDYLASIKDGKNGLIDLGLGDLTYAVGGGVCRGEMVIFAGRPNHGKSSVALQCIHHWTSLGMPCVFISEEMSRKALGKRTVQYVTPLPEEHWADQLAILELEIADFEKERAKCWVIENSRTTAAACASIERFVRDQGVQCAIVDYAQLLHSPGQGRYEQITNTSIALRQLASSQDIILLVLCQLNRDIEKRREFTPLMSDLKDTGQLEQDADVIVFLVRPWIIDKNEDPQKFQFFIAKNRNRQMNMTQVLCRFDPRRQMFKDPIPEVSNDGVL